MSVWAPDIQRFLDVWADGELHDDIGTALSCTEAEALANLFRFLGDDEAALPSPNTPASSAKTPTAWSSASSTGTAPGGRAVLPDPGAWQVAAAYLAPAGLAFAALVAAIGGATLFEHLVARWRDLFNASFDVLLYDLTSTYFESAPSDDDNDKRRFGYSPQETRGII